MKNSENVCKRLTCYERHDNENTQCLKNNCDHWVNSNTSNCAIICSKQKLTFEQIGKMFDLTRMRICQIEKKALKKIRYSILIKKSSLNKNSS